MFSFRSKRTEPTPPPWDLDHPLLHLTSKDVWTLSQAMQGVQIFGTIGSGKTSGSGATLARTYLANGFGGLVLTVKPDEAGLWRKYARETNSESRLVVFSPDSPYRFNFLEYEFSRPGGGRTENIVSLFYSLLEVIEGESNRSADSYWERAVKQLLRNAIDILAVAEGTVSLSSLKELINSAPPSLEAVSDPQFMANLYLTECILHGEERIAAGGVSPIRQADFEDACRYWLREYPALNDRTRTIITSSFTSMIDTFLRGDLRELFCTDTTITPEWSHDGKIIVLDLPVKTWEHIGRSAQLVFKYLWQNAAERRRGEKLERPIFLWADEAQFFFSPRDEHFQSTARTARVATVYLTQSLSNYYAMTRSKDRVAAFLGNMNTKIFHMNTDPVTNEWAADMIARSWQTQASITSSPHEDDKKLKKQENRSSVNISRSLQHEVIPGAFTRLRTGGTRNQLIVDGIVFVGGGAWSNGKTYLNLGFTQE